MPEDNNCALRQAKIIDLDLVRACRFIKEVYRNWVPSTMAVDGVLYQWTEEGYFSSDGRMLTLEDLE